MLYSMAYTKQAELYKLKKLTIITYLKESTATWAYMYTLACFFKEIVHLIKLCSA
jgi:hypothetical protein